MKTYKKIVITGGPCAGKTTALEKIREHYEALGCTVIIVPETATELLFGGVSLNKMPTRVFQKILLELQLHKEACFLKGADETQDEKLVVFFDRGAIDGKAYMKDEEYAQNLAELGLNEAELFARYDGIICLETAANAPGDLYQTENNITRFESKDVAQQVDAHLYEVWHTHPNFNFIPASEKFQDKLNVLFKTIDKIILR